MITTTRNAGIQQPPSQQHNYLRYGTQQQTHQEEKYMEVATKP
jgi:hypothetical protein